MNGENGNGKRGPSKATVLMRSYEAAVQAVVVGVVAIAAWTFVPTWVTSWQSADVIEHRVKLGEQEREKIRSELVRKLDETHRERKAIRQQIMTERRETRMELKQLRGAIGELNKTMTRVEALIPYLVPGAGAPVSPRHTPHAYETPDDDWSG